MQKDTRDIGHSDEQSLDAKPLPPPQPKTTMAVSELQKIFGLGKTEAYWLVHKNFFRTVLVSGKIRIDIASFEDWYARQVKYKKVDGPPPGEILRQESYSAREIGEILGLSESYSYEVMKQAGLKPILVDCRQRWLKDVFDEWYASQTRYRTQEDRELDADDVARSMSMPEMACLLNVPRSTVYSILSEDRKHQSFDFVVAGGQKRVTKDSFMAWYQSQSKYQMAYPTIEGAQADKLHQAPTSQESRRQKQSRKKEPDRIYYLSGKSSNPNYLSLEEVSTILGQKKRTILKKIHDGIIPAISIAGSYRIPRAEFEEWLQGQQSTGKEET